MENVSGVQRWNFRCGCEGSMIIQSFAKSLVGSWRVAILIDATSGEKINGGFGEKWDFNEILLRFKLDRYMRWDALLLVDENYIVA